MGQIGHPEIPGTGVELACGNRQCILLVVCSKANSEGTAMLCLTARVVRRYRLKVAIPVALLAICWLMLWRGAKEPTLQHSIGSAIGLREDAIEQLVVNLPLQGGRALGSIYTDLSLPAVGLLDLDSAQVMRGPVASVSVRGGIATELEVSLLGMGQTVSGSGARQGSWDLVIDSFQVLSINDTTLRDRLLTSGTLLALYTRGHDPFLITTCYTGRLRARRARHDSLSATANAKMADSAGARAGSLWRVGADGSLETAGIVVFAFQAMRVHFLTTHLGSSGPDSVELRPLFTD